jgi:hypothetical protein
MKSLTLILLSLMLPAWWTPTYAQDSEDVVPEPLVLTEEQSKYPLGMHLELLEDPGGELTIEDVTSPEYADQFSPSVDEVPNFGFTDSAYWVRLRLRDENPLIDTWLLGVDFENTHFVDLYSPSADGAGFEVRQTGAMRSPSVGASWQIQSTLTWQAWSSLFTRMMRLAIPCDSGTQTSICTSNWVNGENSSSA